MKSSFAYIAMASISISFFLGACSAGKGAVDKAPVIEVKQKNIGGEEARALPKATAFRMSGDYMNNVAITLNSDGSIAYYPDPSDLSKSSIPYALADGWYLNRQGISANSVFTSYTFEDYMALQQPPSQQELLAAVIPGARVTDFIQLPVNLSEALANPVICIKYLPK